MFHVFGIIIFLYDCNDKFLNHPANIFRMNIDDKLLYLIKIHLYVDYLNDSPQESFFSTECTLTFKQKKFHFNEMEVKDLYETNIDDVFISLDKSLIKSTDFLRRCAYRYDGVQVSIDNFGGIGVKNKLALLRQWESIRSLLLSDYKGFFVDDYLMRINNITESSEEHNMPMNNYFYYGLILFGIPHETPIGWSRIRNVMLSDFDDVVFVEKLNHEQDMDDKRCFSIVGENINESTNCRIDKYYGRAQVPMNSFFPDWVQLEIDYTKEDINVYWKYELTKQAEQ